MDKEKDFFKIEILGRLKSLTDVAKSEGFIFTIPESFESSDFFDEKGFPNKAGSKMITRYLIEALVGNIFTVHGAGHYDKSEHIPDAVNLLEKLLNSKWKVHAGFDDPFDDPDQPKTE